MKTRFFDMAAGAMSQPPVEPIFDRTPHPFGRRPGRSGRLRRLAGGAAPADGEFRRAALCRHDDGQRAGPRHGGPAFPPASGDGAGWVGCAPGRPPASRRRPSRVRRRPIRHRNRCRRRPRDRALGRHRSASPCRAPGYGSILLGPASRPGFDPAADRAAVCRMRQRLAASATRWTRRRRPAGAWPGRWMRSSPARPASTACWSPRPSGCWPNATARSGPGSATPSWSMTKAITCTVIGRMIHEGWLRSMHDPAPAPLWSDPRAIHRLITLDHLVRMRSGLGFPGAARGWPNHVGFENSAVYQDAGDAFEAAQRSIVATIPGSVFRYVNSGMNVLGVDHPRPDRAARAAVLSRPPTGCWWIGWA